MHHQEWQLKTQPVPALPQDAAHGFSAGFDSMLAKECAALVERLSTAVRWIERFGKKTLAKGVKDARQALAFARRLQSLSPGALNPVEQELLVPLIPLLCSIYEPRLQRACQRKFGYGLSRCMRYKQEHEEYLAEKAHLVALLEATDSVSEYHRKELSKIDSLLSLETGAEELLQEENLPDEIIQAAIATAKEIVHYASDQRVMHSSISKEMRKHRSFAVVTLVQQLNHLKSGVTDGSFCGRLGKYVQYADLLCIIRIKWPAMHPSRIPAQVRVGSALNRAQVVMQGKTIMLRLVENYDGSVEAYEFREQHGETLEAMLKAAQALGIDFRLCFKCGQRIFPKEEKRLECIETYTRLQDKEYKNNPDPQS